MKQKNKSYGLFAGTIILLISNIFVKGLGFFYRVVLVRILGAQGIGLIEMVSPLYSFLLVLAGCGVQPALSQIIAGRGQNKRKAYFRTAVLILLITGSLVTVAAFCLTPFLTHFLVPDSRIQLCFTVLLPAVFIISLASPWRGYLQGLKQVSAIGMSQNVEQVVRVIVGIYLAKQLLAYGLETAVAAASAASVCGELAGFLYLIYYVRKLDHKPLWQAQKKPPLADFFAEARDLLSYGIPLTGGRLATTAIAMVQAFLIPLCLQSAGWDTSAATEIYGRFSGVAMSLLHLPGVFTAALSVSVLPAVAESAAENIAGKGLEKRISDALFATIAFTLPGMAVLYLYATPLCVGLFNNAAAADILVWLAPFGIFLYLQITLASILQGLGEVRKLLANNILSGILMLIGIALLTPKMEFGIIGTAIAVGISWLAGSLLHFLSMRKTVQIQLPWKQIVGVPLQALAAAIALFVVLDNFFPFGQNQLAALLIPGLAAALVYLLILWKSGQLKLLRRKN